MCTDSNRGRQTEIQSHTDRDTQRKRDRDRPATLHDVRDECVEHENDENSNKNVINCTYVTDLQQLTTTTTSCTPLQHTTAR